MIAIRRRISTPFSGVSGSPATVAEPEVGAMSVPSVRTVVVFPAPFGPRKPKTSPWPISKETSCERDPVAEALAQAAGRTAPGRRSPRRKPPPADVAECHEERRSSRRGPQARPAREAPRLGARPGTSVRRRSLLMSHLIR